MIKYAEISDLNCDQVKLIQKNGWCFFTECDGEETYWHKGFHKGNRVGYIVLSKDIEMEDINSPKKLKKIAKFDNSFNDLVMEKLLPLADKCYVFLVKDPANYHFEQIYTNEGLEKAKEIIKLRFSFKCKYYEKEEYRKMVKLIDRHNRKVEKGTAKAIEILQANGFKVVSQNFAAIRKEKWK